MSSPASWPTSSGQTSRRWPRSRSSPRRKPDLQLKRTGHPVTQHIPPPWLTGPPSAPIPSAPVQTPTTAPERAGRWVKGQSGNPAGRPPGRPDPRTKITRALMDEGVEIARVVTAAAKDGDLQAASLVLLPHRPSAPARGSRSGVQLQPAGQHVAAGRGNPCGHG
ncbi:DUF5681 domain-containing protein [Sphingomonas glaciei]|uniref:DUF5681 domain-containing protein n=1 Tax=Sphingomonas glaciei TaxID=2938948 RepID=UPI003873061A